VSRVGLVLGGGGITGAAYHLGVLLAIEMATGWSASDAEVIVGTSGGAAVAAVVRGEHQILDALVGDASGRSELAEDLHRQLYRRARPGGVMRWIRHGLIPGVRKPGFSMLMGSPAPYTASGIADWVASRTGAVADSWPDEPTIIVAYDLEAKERIPFGTEDSPDVPLKIAVSASSAVPMIYEPVEIDGRLYVDGGVASGTSADFVLGNPEPLDLVVLIAPMAADEHRSGALFYEDLLDRAGREALAAEVDHIRRVWPKCDVLVLKPDPGTLETLRPNPLSTSAAIPGFLHTLRSLRDELSKDEVWSVLAKHLVSEDSVTPG
jgi:NTE family protein